MSQLVPNRPSPSQIQQSNNKAPNSRAFCSIPEQIMHQALKTPESVALVSETETLTYQQLNQRSNQLAHYLHQQGLGAGSESHQLVAIQLTRSPAAIIAFLAILKAGAAYVPIDPNYPAARQQYILQDSKAEILLTETCFISAHSNYSGRCICWDNEQSDIERCSKDDPSEISQSTIQPDDLAYVIYTSGTTGNPKGVMITHQGLANHGNAMAKAFNITRADRVLQFSSLSFDIVVEEIYPTLISGAALVLRPEEIATSITAFLQFTAAENITILNIPTAFWHELVGGLVRILAKEQTPKTDWLSPTVRLVIVGGEQASRTIYAQWRELFGVYPRWLNAYGPTEATVSATLYDPLAENYDLSEEIPIGRAIDNLETFILDEALEPVKPGDAGELYIGGLGLAKGYLNRPEKTAAAFVSHPFRAGDRLYKTGDIVSELTDGNIKFCGRADFQEAGHRREQDSQTKNLLR
ncbi:MAG: amino acid adenylation domain-containing protein [Cyanobacteria bacterium P01_F01_bin.53]